jgi:hypothetical protein
MSSFRASTSNYDADSVIQAIMAEQNNGGSAKNRTWRIRQKKKARQGGPSKGVLR